MQLMNNKETWVNFRPAPRRTLLARDGLRKYGKKRPRPDLIQMLIEYTLVVLRASSIHGLAHLGRGRKRHFVERLIWLVTIGCGVTAAVWLSLSTMRRYWENPTVISLERNYLEWNTTFPAVTLCPKTRIDNETLLQLIQQLFPEESPGDVYESLENLVDARYDTFSKLQPISDKLASSDYLRTVLRISFNISYSLTLSNSETADLVPNLTELGLCYTFNSEISTYNNPDYWLSNNWTRVPSPDIFKGSPLEGDAFASFFKMNSGFRAYIHDFQEIPDPSSRSIFFPFEYLLQMEVSAMSIYSTETTRRLRISQRKCRYWEESNLKTTPIYSYNMCRAECRMQLALQLCNCLPYFYRPTSSVRICDIKGMLCLASYKERLVKMRDAAGDKVECRCDPLCDRTSYVFNNENLVSCLFWTCSCILALWGLMVLFFKSYNTYVENPISFHLKKDHLAWNTSFVAVSVCQTDADVGGTVESADKLFGEGHDLDLETFLRQIVFFDGTCYSCDTHCGKSINCTENLKYLIDNTRLVCEDLIKDCFWLEQSVNCCNHFKILVTETGPCFSFNSLHTQHKDAMRERYIINKDTGPGSLVFKVTKDVIIYLHTEEDVPFVNIPREEKNFVVLRTDLSISFMVTETENDPMLHTIPVEKRKCRLPSDNILDSYSYYSYSACVVDCRARAQVQLCNCTHHFMPILNNTKTCDLHGLVCLSRHSRAIGSLRTEDSNKVGLVCPCYPSCTEHDYKIVENIVTPSLDENSSSIKISMKSLPRTRYSRYIVRTKLDLVVSLGGTVGLFLGVSLLSLVECVYLLLIYKKNRGNTALDFFEFISSKPKIPTKTRKFKSKQNLKPKIPYLP